MNVQLGLTSPFPRSEALVAATRDYDRGRTTADALEELFVRTEGEVVDLERRLGFDQITAGYLRWADLFRPIAESWGGFTVGPVTRWFETNTFFRQPILHAPPERVPGALLRALPPPLQRAPAPAKAILPGPYTLTGLIDNRSGETDEALLHRFGRLLAEEVRELRGAGIAVFEFQEPLLAVRPPQRSIAESVQEAYRSIEAARDGGTTIVWTAHGDGVGCAELLGRLAASVVGLDLTETDPERLPTALERRALGLGVLDPRTTLVEEAGDIVRIVRAVADRLHPPAVYLGPGASLDLLPWEPATRKLHALPAARQLLQGGGRPR